MPRPLYRATYSQRNLNFARDVDFLMTFCDVDIMDLYTYARRIFVCQDNLRFRQHHYGDVFLNWITQLHYKATIFRSPVYIGAFVLVDFGEPYSLQNLLFYTCVIIRVLLMPLLLYYLLGCLYI